MGRLLKNKAVLVGICIAAGLFIALIGFIAVAPQDTASNKARKFEIVQNENVSHIKCSRGIFRVAVPKDINGDEIEPTMHKVFEEINNNMPQYQYFDEYTIWFWNDKNLIGKTSYNVAMGTYGNCNDEPKKWIIKSI